MILFPEVNSMQGSEAHLIKLLSDTSIPNIVRATSAHYLGNLPTQNSLQALIKCLGDNDAQTRYRALRSLSNFPAATWRDAAAPLLADKIRAVRIAAAELFVTIPSQEIAEVYHKDFASARNELQSYLAYQADFSVRQRNDCRSLS
jgi:HEAT repeat protein